MRRVAIALAVIAVAASGTHAAKTKLRTKNLLSVVTPTRQEPARAHPFVNLIVLFGSLSDGTPADPGTFHARIGHQDITDRFEPYLDANGRQIGLRATLDPSMVKLGHRPRNHVRLSIEAAKASGTKGPRLGDVDRLRFGAVEVPDSPPDCVGNADTEVVLPGVAVQFTGSKASTDPDRDAVTYHWDFGDGTTADAADPQHVYDVRASNVTATLSCSDGALASTAPPVVLLAVPQLDPAKTAGTIHIDGATALDFAAVAPGTSATKTVTISNTDPTTTSQVKVRLATTSSVFSLSDPALTLGPGESHDLTLTFAPTAPGHQDARLSIVAAATNRQSVSLLMHGYGGSGPGSGPTLVADPVFFTTLIANLLGFGTFGFLPSGAQFSTDSGVHGCVVPSNGPGTGDYCLSDQDCAANGGTCPATSTCPSGPNAGKPCSVPSDCPQSYCPSFQLFNPVETCSDGQSLYLLSDDGTYTDPNPNDNTEISETIMRIDYDANGNTTNKQILYRPTTETGQLACDGFPASQGGQIYIAEYHELPDSGSCFRSEREALVTIAKSTGATQVLAPRIDAYEGLSDCADDLDNVDQLVVARDAGRTFAGFDLGGLWQIRPTPIFFSPDITSGYQAHPDGTVLYAQAIDSGSTGLVNLYRITPAEVEHGALPFSALVPCASFAVPNNGGRTAVLSFAADRDAVDSQTATGLVSFIVSAPNFGKDVTAPLTVQGTVAFSAPPNDTTCSVLGLVNLQALDQLSF
jgi:phage baseplate assembly protein gpV